MPSVTQEEKAKYWDIFQSQEPVNGLVSGDKMFKLLKNSQLDDSKLEKVWDLADIDGDGSMDFDEFTVAMRLVFDTLQNNISSIPSAIPDWLVPSSKRHLVDAKQAISGGNNVPRVGSQDDDDDDDYRLSSDFNWYISPSDRNNYTSIYSVNADPLGKISFESLTELYQSLGIPDTDISSAWNLVNPRSDERIDKEQCIVFLHILNNRSKGVRIPRSVPAQLRATFGKQQPSYDVDSSQAQISRPAAGSNKKTGFAEGYLSRLGLGGRKAFSTSGTDFSSTKDTDWEEVRLKRELEDLEDLIAKIEAAKKDRASGGQTSLVRRELQLLLEYKENQLKAARSPASSSGSSSLSSVRQEVDMIAEQVDGLKEHLKNRQSELARIQAEIAAL